ncbi:MAG: hypothetical protein IJA56_07430 [Clostridia bacterium]|nr:hypothetical protein [Clostridia bacterium]
MTEVIGVRFKKVGKVYYFDPCGIQVKDDQPVIVETARGLEYGEVAMSNSQVEDDKIVQPLKKLVRLATEADRKTIEQNLQFEKDAFKVCEEKIQKHKLEMKLVSVEYTFDRSKILFYFSADGRVDFRELVKDLAGVFRTRIELRQIGVRDEAKMIGGLGICGRPLCCSAFLESFQPVSINMAKDQGLSLNPTKISGTCGRLMCCLKYENDAYQDLIKQTPPNESLVDTPQGRGTVLDSSLLRGTCRVRMLNSSDAPVTVPCDQCTVLRRGRDKGEPLDLPAPPQVKAAPAPQLTLEEDEVQQEQNDKPRRDRDRKRNDNRENRETRENRDNRGNRQGGHKNKPAQQGEKPKNSGEKPRNNGDRPKNQGEKPKNLQDKPKKDKPQQEHKPAEQQGAPKEGGEHKRRHRGGRRTHRGGGDKPQAPKAE